MDSKGQAQFQQMQRAYTAQQIPRTVTAAATVALADYLVACDATSAGFTLTLPAVKDARGMSFLVVKIDSTTNVVTIDGSGSETINGATTQALSAQYASARLYCDGTAWYAHLVGTAGQQTYTSTTFTPGIAFGGASTGITYSVQTGRYVRVGVQVQFVVRIVLTSKGSATGNATITGLPITAVGFGAVTAADYANLTGAGLPIGLINSGSTIALQYPSATVSVSLADTHFNNNTTLIMGGSYFVA